MMDLSIKAITFKFLSAIFLIISVGIHMHYNTGGPKRDPIKNYVARSTPGYNYGRLQFFYHSPSSILPIRDVLNEQKMGAKTEPHIEIGAENYWSSCFQSNNIKPLVLNGEKYLFLMTTCQNTGLKKYLGNRYIVGCIENQEHGVNTTDCNGKDVYYVKGDTRLFSFDDAYPYSNKVRSKIINEAEAKLILNHFSNKKNILQECVKEIVRLDRSNRTCLRLRDGKDCRFTGECLRRKLR